MQAFTQYTRLVISGLFLDRSAYREQRDFSHGLQRGLFVVLLVGLVVGLATTLGHVLSLLINPSAETVTTTAYNALINTEWFRSLPDEQAASIDQSFIRSVVDTFTVTPLSAFLPLLLTPLSYVLVWAIFSPLMHALARAMGGQGSLGQTMSCTALASGAQLFNLVQLIPLSLNGQILNLVSPGEIFTRWLAVPLLSIVCYCIALQEAHQLSHWRALSIVVLVPVFLSLLFGCAGFVILLLIGGGR